jgi:hypothetical protein
MISDSELRVTRSRLSLQRSVLLFASCLMLVAALRAQEEPTVPPVPAPAAQEAGPQAPAEQAPEDQPPPADGAKDAGPSEAAAATPAESAPKQEPAPKQSSPTRFEPTEKVRADFDVSFPIDI